MTNDQLNIAELPQPFGFLYPGNYWSTKPLEGATARHAYSADDLLAAQAPLIERIKELEKSAVAADGVIDKALARVIELEKQNAELRDALLDSNSLLAQIGGDAYEQAQCQLLDNKAALASPQGKQT